MKLASVLTFVLLAAAKAAAPVAIVYRPESSRPAPATTGP
jgi:hypothetical protein